VSSSNFEAFTLVNDYKNINLEDINPKIVSINPNPLEYEAEITVSGTDLPITLCIYDAFGTEVRTIETNTNRIQLKRGKLVSGMYKLVLITATGARRQKHTLIVN
jgi:hypothetical protein